MQVAEKDAKVIQLPVFPIGIFPPFLQSYITELNRSLNFSKDFLSVSVMFAIATLNGNKYKLQVKRGWNASTIFWFACVGHPGTIKTHPVKTILKPLSVLDRASKKRYDEEMRHFNPESNNPHSRPRFKQTLISDYTIEALHKVHDINPRGLGLYRDELNGFLNDMNRYRKGSDVEFWLESFNNGSYIVNRVKSEPVMVNDICINIIGTIQHEVLDRVISEYSGNGMIDRFLFTAAETGIYPLPEQEISEKYESEWQRMVQGLSENLQYIDAEDTRLITINKDAFGLYQNIDQQFVRLQQSEEENQDIKNYLSKMKTYVPRFALLLAVIDSGFSGEMIDVTDDHFFRADQLSSYFIQTARDVFSANQTRVDIRSVEQSFKGRTRADKIRELLREGFKQQEIADYFGISKQAVSRIASEKK